MLLLEQFDVVKRGLKEAGVDGDEGPGFVLKDEVAEIVVVVGVGIDAGQE